MTLVEVRMPTIDFIVLAGEVEGLSDSVIESRSGGGFEVFEIPTLEWERIKARVPAEMYEHAEAQLVSRGYYGK